MPRLVLGWVRHRRPPADKGIPEVTAEPLLVSRRVPDWRSRSTRPPRAAGRPERSFETGDAYDRNVRSTVIDPKSLSSLAEFGTICHSSSKFASRRPCSQPRAWFSCYKLPVKFDCAKVLTASPPVGTDTQRRDFPRVE